MKLPALKIGNLIAKIPIIQGGMGIGISKSKLASAVANEGAIGIISSVQLGYLEKDFESNTEEANKRGLIKEIKKARKLSPNGILGVNMLVAAKNYDEIVKTAISEKIDIIISGAGLPTDLPKFVKGTDTKCIPIVSSGKAAHIISKLWIKKYNYIPDAFIIEGPKAGGHLGFSMKEMINSTYKTLEEILKEVLEVKYKLEIEYNKSIPVIVAGGIDSGKQIADFIRQGASGVQIASPFVTTKECDAHDNFKKAYLDAKKEKDIVIIQSPVGLPGRAINNSFVKTITTDRMKITKCFNCIKKCNPAETRFCITKALINAVNGDIENGLIFAGANTFKLNKIITVKKLINNLIEEAEKNY
ncbi:NAD(P)H-dependent flavin oxidoreductase [Clostridium sp. DL1XJH146]